MRRGTVGPVGDGVDGDRVVVHRKRPALAHGARRDSIGRMIVVGVCGGCRRWRNNGRGCRGHAEDSHEQRRHDGTHPATHRCSLTVEVHSSGGRCTQTSRRAR